MDDKNICVNVRLMTDDILGTVTANRKLSRKVRGLGGWIFGLVVTCVVLISELAERKRCEKYLEEQIDDLKEELDSKSDTESGSCDAIDIQGQIDDLEDRVNDLAWTVKKLKRIEDQRQIEYAGEVLTEEVSDGGVCDA